MALSPKVTLTCPKCGNQVSQGEDDTVPETCPKCGKHVEWQVSTKTE